MQQPCDFSNRIGAFQCRFPQPASQRFVHHRPITAGDEVLGTTTVDAVRSAGGHAMVTTRTELSTSTGDALATSTSTIVVRGGED